jgi:hypothetical protein
MGYLISDTDAVSAETIKRQRELADALLAQGLTPRPIRHWTQGAAQLASALTGGLMSRRADRAEERGQQAVADALAKGGDIGTVGKALVATPYGRQLGEQLLMKNLEPKTPIKLGQGEQLLEPGTYKPLVTSQPPDKIGGTVEGIRAKLARGEPLTPSENQVYQDALRADPLTRLLQGGGGLQPPAAPSMPQSSGPLPFEPNAQNRKIGQVYALPNGKQALWSKDDQGNTGWELLN